MPPMPSRPALLLLLLSALALYVLFSRTSSPPYLLSSSSLSPRPPTAAAAAGGPATALAAPERKAYKRRIVAVGDVHGDLAHLTRILRFSKLINLRGNWVGKDAILVQTGDCIDRGKDTIAIYRLWDQLRTQAREAGGGVVNVLGNHEYMNAMGDWRYVLPSDIDTFGSATARRHAISSEGWIGKSWLANYSVTARVPYFAGGAALPAGEGGEELRRRQEGQFVLDAPKRSTHSHQEEDPFALAAASFVHGGLLPSYPPLSSSSSSPVQQTNKIGRSLLLRSLQHALSPTFALPPGTTAEEAQLYSAEGPLWDRTYALGEEEVVCKLAEEAAKKLGVRRLVMGHTPQMEGIRARCGGKVLLIDVGLSNAYGGPLAALEINYQLTPSTLLSVAAAAAEGEGDEAQEEAAPKKGKESEGKEEWLEREVVSALYEGRKEQLAKSERTVWL